MKDLTILTRSQIKLTLNTPAREATVITHMVVGATCQTHGVVFSTSEAAPPSQQGAGWVSTLTLSADSTRDLAVIVDVLDALVPALGIAYFDGLAEDGA